MDQLQTSYTIIINGVSYTMPDDFIGGGSLPSGVVDLDFLRYENLSGETARWSAYSGNTFQYDYPIQEPLRIIYDGSPATEGADKDSLADHEWVYDTGVLYLRDDSGDLDSLAYGLWQADFWGVESGGSATNLYGTTWGRLDSSTDQGFLIIELPELTSDVSTVTLNIRVTVSDGSTSGTLTLACKDSVVKDDSTNTAPTDTTITSGAAVTLPADGAPQITSIVINKNDLDAVDGERPLIMVYRNTSAGGNPAIECLIDTVVGYKYE